MVEIKTKMLEIPASFCIVLGINASKCVYLQTFEAALFWTKKSKKHRGLDVKTQRCMELKFKRIKRKNNHSDKKMLNLDFGL